MLPSHRPLLPDTIRSIYIIAICGTAMGSLAGLLKQAGFDVVGSDVNVYPPMSTSLAAQGISILQGFDAAHLRDHRPDLVVIGNAVSRSNPEVEETLAQGLPYLSMPEALAHFFLHERTPVVIAGTHGKTTTSSLTAWLLQAAGLDPSFLIGGIVQNFKQSYQLGRGNYFVIEGDEYDTAFFDKGPKFYHYRPRIAAITSLEFDHADIFPDLATIETHFARFSGLLPADGALFYCSHYPNLDAVTAATPARRISYGLRGDETLTAARIDQTAEGTLFEVLYEGKSCGTWRSPLSGEHNLLNTLAAIGIARHVGIPDDRIQAGLRQFAGIKRRQEVRGQVRGVTVIDDFAHHPTAVRETIRAVRSRYPGQRLWAVFEPRSNTSMRAVFQDDFAQSLAEADRVVIAPVFRPDKIKDAAVLDTNELADTINRIKAPTGAKVYTSVDEIIHTISSDAQSQDVILIMSNGGFDNIHDRLLRAL